MQIRHCLCNLVIATILFNQFGCSKPKYRLNNALDCVLESTISQVNDKTNFNIITSELRNLSDSTSLMVFTFPKKELTTIDATIYRASFGGVDVYFHGDSYIRDDTISKEDQATNLDIWKSSSIVFKEKNIKLNSNLFMPPYSPPEVQFEYNRYEDCVESILLLRWIEKEKIIQSCKLCHQ